MTAVDTSQREIVTEETLISVDPAGEATILRVQVTKLWVELNGRWRPTITLARIVLAAVD